MPVPFGILPKVHLYFLLSFIVISSFIDALIPNRMALFRCLGGLKCQTGLYTHTNLETVKEFTTI